MALSQQPPLSVTAHQQEDSCLAEHLKLPLTEVPVHSHWKLSSQKAHYAYFT